MDILSYVGCPSHHISLHLLSMHLFVVESGHVFRLVMDITRGLHSHIIPSKDMDVDSNCRKILAEVRMGLQRNKVPAKTDLLDCTGGVYFMKTSSGAQVAVFKPSDEEQGMPNNPKGIYETSKIFRNIYFPVAFLILILLHDGKLEQSHRSRR